MEISVLSASSGQPLMDVRGQPPKSRMRLTTLEYVAMDAAIYDVLHEHAQSVRHVYYRLYANGFIDKTLAAYKQVGRRCKLMREDGRLPFEWVTDGSRTYYDYRGHASVEEWGEEAIEGFMLNYWKDLDTHIEVWCESESIAGVLNPICAMYHTNLYPGKGQPSLTFVWQAAKALVEQGKGEATIIYIGDYDDAGMQIGESVEAKFRRYVTRYCQEQYNEANGPEADFYQEQHTGLIDMGGLTFSRIAINEQQIVEYNLPTQTAKAPGKRGIFQSVECEAMPVETLQQLLMDALSEYIPPSLLRYLQAEQAEQRKDIAARLRGPQP